MQCYTLIFNPQPPMTDPIWAGNTTGAIYNCNPAPSGSPTAEAYAFWSPNAPAPSAVDPAALATTAFKKLTIASPTAGRYPAGHEQDGTAFVPLGYDVWLWSASAPQTATAVDGKVSATATATPSMLTFDPGDGGSAVVCKSLGTVWQPGDARYGPSPSGCQYVYTKTSADEPQEKVTGTWTVSWSVSWTSSTGATGTLPSVTSTTTDRFHVDRVEALVTN